MAAALDLRAEIRVHDALRELGPDHALAHGDEIQVEVLDQCGLQRLTGMVCRDPDLQATFIDASALRISSVEIAPSRSTFTSCVVQSTIVDEM